MSNFTLTQKAVDDLTNIWNYTYDQWSENQADIYYELLISACKELNQKNTNSKSYDDILNGLFGQKVGKHIIFYRQMNDLNVEVIRFLHESMDYQRHFS